MCVNYQYNYNETTVIPYPVLFGLIAITDILEISGGVAERLRNLLVTITTISGGSPMWYPIVNQLKHRLLGMIDTLILLLNSSSDNQNHTRIYVSLDLDFLHQLLVHISDTNSCKSIIRLLCHLFVCLLFIPNKSIR
jgi:hypothetical protein